MHIEFATHHLAEASLSLSAANRLFDVPVGRKYIQRLAILRATDRFSQLYGHRSLRLHTLKGNRGGQHSITITGNYRLIIEMVKEDHVSIVDMEDYHGN